MRSSGPKEDEVARNIAGLAALDRTGISAAWCQAFGAPPPRKLSRVLMEKALAHQMQCKAFGGLDAASRRVLRQAHGGGAAKPPARSLSPGSRLMREWNGRTHEVEVLEAGSAGRVGPGARSAGSPGRSPGLTGPGRVSSG